jgi:hypothetical protein
VWLFVRLEEKSVRYRGGCNCTSAQLRQVAY